MTDDPLSLERFKIMECRPYFGIMMPSRVLTAVFGVWLRLGYGFSGVCLDSKLVLSLLALHFYPGRLMSDFKHNRNRHGHLFYRWLNEIPALPLLIFIVILAVVKPL